MYFDSPTEDPEDSDPLEPSDGYVIDGLDFRWEPFNRKDANQRDTEEIQAVSRKSVDQEPLNLSSHMAIDDYDEEMRMDSMDTPEPTVYKDDDCSMDLGASSSVDPSHRMRLLSSQSDEAPPQESELLATSEPKSNNIAFAPAPGIFLSPLRRPPNSQELDGDTPPEKRSSHV